MRNVRRHFLLRGTVGGITLEADTGGMVEVSSYGLHARLAPRLGGHRSLNASHFAGNVIIPVWIVGGILWKVATCRQRLLYLTWRECLISMIDKVPSLCIRTIEAMAGLGHHILRFIHALSVR